MQLRWVALIAVLLLVLLSVSGTAAPRGKAKGLPHPGDGELPDTFVVYAGTTHVEVGSETFVVETERTIMLIIEELTTNYVAGEIQVLEDLTSHVSMYWVRHGVVIFDDVVEKRADFEYDTETGHAEKRDEDPLHPADNAPR